MTKVIKKDGTKVDFNEQKIIDAISKSAERAMHKLTPNEVAQVLSHIRTMTNGMESIEVKKLHNMVEASLELVVPNVAKRYREYRDYKLDFVKMLDEVYQTAQNIMFTGDKSNANTDSTLVTTKRCLVYNELNKELYNKFFLNTEEKQACRDGYIYIHDKSARRDTMNCCLFDAKSVMSGGFEMGNLWYNEPNSIDVACDVLGDIIMMSASMQYGGWSTRVDDLLAPYVEKSYNKYFEEWYNISQDIIAIVSDSYGFNSKIADKLADKYAMEKARRDLEQGIQGLEYKLNSVASSRGDYPFTTFAIGLGTSKWEKMVSETVLKVRMEGQGKKGKKKPVLFPKIIFLYDENLHGEGKELEDLFNLGVECSSKAMYPDWLSLTGEGYVADIYKKYGEVIYAMGCRAFLSPWYRKGGISPLDETDTPVYTGRFNIGAITLNMIMIYQKAQEEGRDFYEVLDYYLEMIRKLHIRTYEYLSHMKASTNPLAYMEGGFYGGHLNADDEIAPLLKSATASFGITGLNELQRLHNGKSIREDGEFALEVMNYINKKVDEYKYADGNLYAIYGTPAESLCGLQIEQFRAKYGIVENVSDKAYTTNSFHCHVSEEMSGFEKQDKEARFWNLFNGGKIQYVRYPIGYNKQAIATMLRRAMGIGFYEGVNLELAYCDDCGYEHLEMDACPICGSENITRISRMNGYLGYTRVKGDTRMNEAKMQEVRDRRSM